MKNATMKMKMNINKAVEIKVTAFFIILNIYIQTYKYESCNYRRYNKKSTR